MQCHDAIFGVIKNVALVVLGGILVFAGGCRRQSSTVTVIPRSTATLLWEPLKQGVNDEFHDGALSVRWDSLRDEDDVEGQLTLFESAISRQDRGIIFAPDQTLASRSLVIKVSRPDPQIPRFMSDRITHLRTVSRSEA